MRTYFREHLSLGVDFLAAFPDLFAFGLVLTLTGLRNTLFECFFGIILNLFSFILSHYDIGSQGIHSLQ